MRFSPTKLDATDIEAERLIIEGILAALPNDPKTRLNACLEQVFQEKSGVQGLLTRFLYAQTALNLHAAHGLLGRAETEKLVAMAHRLLQLARIRPTTSRLAYLYADVYQTVARIHQADGNSWKSLWAYHKAQMLARNAPRHQRSEQVLTTAQSLFRLGQGKAALELVGHSEAEPSSEATSWLASLYRLKGDGDQARRLLPDGATWGKSWTEAVLARDPTPILTSYRREKGRPSDASPVDLWLWTRAVASTNIAESSHLPSVKQLRRTALQHGRIDEAVFAAAAMIESLYDAERPLEQRLDDASEVLTQASATGTVERELLCLAALTRWLCRFNQMDLAVCTLSRYRELAEAASGGTTKDPFGALEDLSIATLVARYQRNSVPLAAEKSFRVSRAANLVELGKLGARISGMMLAGTLKTWLTDRASKAQVKVKTETEMAATIVEFLTKRKGVLLKLGQISSYFDGPIAAHITEQFGVLQAEVAAMPPAMMRRVFAQETGSSPEDVYQSFDELPFAAGSIGQVHRATLKNGRQVAVKIRYENIKDIIELEMKTVGMVRSLFLKLWPSLNYEAIVAEIRTHLLKETDYALERRQLEFFRNYFQNDPDVWIPETFADYCWDGVLTCELIDGHTFSEFVEVATQEERNHAGGIIARVCLTSNFAAKRFNADPQPGNFLFKDGRVAFIDFGCVKEFDETYLVQRQRGNQAFFRRDMQALGDAYVAQGYVESLGDVDLAYVFRIFNALNAFALKDEPYTVPKDYGMRVFRAFSSENPHKEKFRLPVDSFFSSRIEFGMMAVLHAMGASVNFRRIFLPLIFPEGNVPEPFPEDTVA